MPPDISTELAAQLAPLILKFERDLARQRQYDAATLAGLVRALSQPSEDGDRLRRLLKEKP